MTVVNLNYIVYNDKLEPLLENEAPITSRQVLSNAAYFASAQDHKNADSKKLADLHIRFATNREDEIDITNEEIILLEKALENNSRFAGIVGQILLVLDGKNPWNKINEFKNSNSSADSVG